MMFMSRHGGGRLLRAFAIVSAVVLAAGAVAPAAFASDRQALTSAILNGYDDDLLQHRAACPGPQV